jgi:hypothetical protein
LYIKTKKILQGVNMKFNSKILKISILIAIIFVLIPMVAAEDATDSVYAEEQSVDEISVDEDAALDEDDDAATDGDEDLGEDEDDEITDDETYDDEVDATYASDSSADLSIITFNTPSKVKVGDFIILNYLVFNNGPDDASNVIAHTKLLSGDLFYITAYCNKGIFDPTTGEWYIGDLPAGAYAQLSILCKVLGDAPIITFGTVTSDTPDPDLTNNICMNVQYVGSAEEQVAEAATLPETGNPIMMALLALISVVGLSFTSRKD